MGSWFTHYGSTTQDNLLDVMSNATANFLTSFVTSYWPWILTIGAIFIVGAAFLRLGKFGRR